MESYYIKFRWIYQMNSFYDTEIWEWLSKPELLIAI